MSRQHSAIFAEAFPDSHPIVESGFTRPGSDEEPSPSNLALMFIQWTGRLMLRAAAVCLLFLWFVLALNAESKSVDGRKLAVREVSCVGCIISCDTGRSCEYSV